MDLSRLQQRAEAVGGIITEGKCALTMKQCWTLTLNGFSYTCTDLSPIAARLEAEYRKLAEEQARIGKIRAKVFNHEYYDSWPGEFLRIADELAVKELTMVERLKKERDNLKREPGNRMGMIFDALLDLYERKEK